MMTKSLLLSRYKLSTFLACQRRFELRYLQTMPWPQRPLPEQDEAVIGRGQQFHQLLQRHFLQVPIDGSTIADAQVRGWYYTFQKSNLQLPNGRILPEMSLTIPIGNHLLNGRFDLLVLGENEAGEATADLFDWKTGTPQEINKLKQDWQTRLYLALLAEGGSALFADEQTMLPPENITLTYWYVNDPDVPRTIQYSTADHAENWADLQALVAQIEAHIAQDAWPLTDDLSACQRCAYQTICQRQSAGTKAPLVDNADDLEMFADDLQTAVPTLP